MKPFDIKKAQEGKPFMTRAGKKIINWHLLPDWAGEFRLYAQTEDRLVYRYTIGGQYFSSGPDDRDLVMVPEITYKYMNEYPIGASRSAIMVDTFEACDGMAVHNRVGVLQFTFEDGRMIPEKTIRVKDFKQ